MDCWNWKGCVEANGYAYTSLDGLKIYAHRMAFLVSGGTLIKGLVIMHLCDNPRCCNPSHLRQDTYRANTHDAIFKGRRKGIAYPDGTKSQDYKRSRLARYRNDPEYLKKQREYQKEKYAEWRSKGMR